MEPFVDLIHDACPEETVSCKGLVVLTIEATYVTRPSRHSSQEGTFRSKVIPGQPHEVTGAVAELLGRGNHVETLIQELARFFLGEPVLAHGEQDLESHRSILHVYWYR